MESDGTLLRRNRKHLLKVNEPYNASERQSELNKSDKSAEVENTQDVIPNQDIGSLLKL